MKLTFLAKKIYIYLNLKILPFVGTRRSFSHLLNNRWDSPSAGATTVSTRLANGERSRNKTQWSFAGFQSVFPWFTSFLLRTLTSVTGMFMFKPPAEFCWYCCSGGGFELVGLYTVVPSAPVKDNCMFWEYVKSENVWLRIELSIGRLRLP